MTFFNKKEEVVEIELTSFGKLLRSRGKLMPSYYAFFDDDIIYDPEYGASSEGADLRIRIKTPRRRVQKNISSVEDVDVTLQQASSYQPDDPTNSFAGQEYRDAGEVIQTERTKEILTQEQSRRNAFPPIGTSGNSTEYHPSWKAYMLQGEISSSAPYIPLGDSVINIPQMEVKKRTFTAKAIRGSDENSSIYGYIFPDGSSVTLKETPDDEFLLFLQEKNSSSDVENFSIEVYEIDDTTDKEILIPLDFAKSFRKDRIVDDMIVDEEEPPTGASTDDDPTMVAYFFDMEADQEIDPRILSEAIGSGRFADIRDLESFANSARFSQPDGSMYGNSATDIYGLTHEQIANMTEEALLNAEQQARAAGDLYEEEDNTDECN